MTYSQDNDKQSCPGDAETDFRRQSCWWEGQNCNPTYFKTCL